MDRNKLPRKSSLKGKRRKGSKSKRERASSTEDRINLESVMKSGENHQEENPVAAENDVESSGVETDAVEANSADVDTDNSPTPPIKRKKKKKHKKKRNLLTERIRKDLLNPKKRDSLVKLEEAHERNERRLAYAEQIRGKFHATKPIAKEKKRFNNKVGPIDETVQSKSDAISTQDQPGPGPSSVLSTKAKPSTTSLPKIPSPPPILPKITNYVKIKPDTVKPFSPSPPPRQNKPTPSPPPRQNKPTSSPPPRQNKPTPSPPPLQNKPTSSPSSRQIKPTPSPPPHKNPPKPSPSPRQNAPSASSSARQNVQTSSPSPLKSVPSPFPTPHQNVVRPYSTPRQNVKTPLPIQNAQTPSIPSQTSTTHQSAPSAHLPLLQNVNPESQLQPTVVDVEPKETIQPKISDDVTQSNESEEEKVINPPKPPAQQGRRILRPTSANASIPSPHSGKDVTIEITPAEESNTNIPEQDAIEIDESRKSSRVRAAANWGRAFQKVSERIMAEKARQEQEENSSGTESSSSLDKSAVIPQKKQVKKSCFSRLMKYFTEEEDSDEIEQQKLKEQRQVKLAEKESRKQIKKHRRQLLEKRRKYGDVQYMPLLEHTYSELDISKRSSSKRFDNQDENQGRMKRSKSRSKHQSFANPNLTFEEFTKNASQSLPSKKEAGKFNIIANLVPAMLAMKKAQQTDAADPDKDNTQNTSEAQERAAFLVERFRFRRRSSKRDSEVNTLRDLPGNLHDKLFLRRNMDNLTKIGDDRLSKWQWIGQSSGQIYLKWKKYIREAWTTVDIWNHHIHHIDETYGVSAAVYFRWVRTILKISILYLILTLSFIFFPGGVVGVRETEEFSIRSFLLAEGLVGKSKLFYGAYESVDVEPGHALSSPGFRFLLVIFLIFICNSVFIAARIRGNFATLANTRNQSSKIAGVDYFTTVLTAWDFNVHQKQAAAAQHRAISRDLNLLLDKHYNKSTFVEPKGSGFLYTFSQKGGKYGSEILYWITNILCLFYAIGTFFVLRHILKQRSEARIRQEEHKLSVEISIGTALCISLFTNFFTPLVVWASNQEAWTSQATRIWGVHARVGILYIGIFSAFYEILVEQSNEAKKERNCWEEEVGNELFRIVVFDSIGNVLMTSIIYIFIPWLRQSCAKPGYVVSKTQFDIEASLFELVFLLTLTGVGIPFFPTMPLITVIRLIFLFYWKKYLLFKYCAFSDQPLHLNDLIAPNLMIFFMSYLIICISHIWMVVELHPSPICGSFSQYHNSSYVAIFKDVISHNTYHFMSFFGKPWFAFFTICLLIGLVYTLRAWANATKASVSVLEELLHLERLDRKFLLKAMYNLEMVKKQKRREDESESDTQTGADDINLQEATQEALNATGRTIGHRRRNTLVHMFLRDSELQHLENIKAESQMSLTRKPELASDHHIISLNSSNDEEVPKPRLSRPTKLQPGHFHLKKDELEGLQRQNMSKAAAIFLATTNVLRHDEVKSELYDKVKKLKTKTTAPTKKRQTLTVEAARQTMAPFQSQPKSTDSVISFENDKEKSL